MTSGTFCPLPVVSITAYPGLDIAVGSNTIQTLFDNTPKIILYQNENSTIMDANADFLELVGESRANVIRQYFHEFYRLRFVRFSLRN